ncbi:MAG: O-antigen ligase family protein [Bryobacteraceae bacterium]|nr:O-antigen ligase family protein [Bryobacteraceae bacterium]
MTTAIPFSTNWQSFERRPRGLENFAGWAIMLLVFCIPWGDAIQVFDDLQFSRLLTLPVTVVWLALAARQGARQTSSPHLFMFLFILWACMSLFATVDQYRSLRRLLSYCQLFLVAWLMYQLIRTGQQYLRVMQAYVLGAWVGLGLLTYNFMNGVVMGDGRYTAPGFDPNDLAATMTLGIPIAWHLTFTTAKWRWLNRLYVPCAVIGTLLTASRTGLVMLAVAMVFPALGMRKISLKSKAGLLALLIVTGAAISLFWEDISVHRLTTIGEQLESRDLNGRVEAWYRGIAVFLENPLVGIGGGAFSTAISSGGGSTSAAHNTLLEILVEHGGIGLVCFIAIVISVLRRALRFPARERRLCLTLMLMWAIATMVLSWENRELTWLLWGFCMVPIGAQTAAATASRRPRAPVQTPFRIPQAVR